MPKVPTKRKSIVKEDTVEETVNSRTPPPDASASNTDSKPEKGASKQQALRHVSCVGCRKRKMKCSRTIPCGSCKMRGEECVWLGTPPSRQNADMELDESRRETQRLHLVIDMLMRRVMTLEREQGVSGGQEDANNARAMMELGNSVGYIANEGYQLSHARSVSGPPHLASPIPRAISSPAGGTTSEPFHSSDLPVPSSFQTEVLRIRSHPPSPNLEPSRGVFRPPIPLNSSESVSSSAAYESPIPGSSYHHASSNAPTSPLVAAYESPLPRHYETYPPYSHHQQSSNSASGPSLQPSPALNPHSQAQNGTTSTNGTVYSTPHDLSTLSHQERFDLAYNSMSARGRPGPVAALTLEGMSRAGWAPSPANTWYERR